MLLFFLTSIFSANLRLSLSNFFNSLKPIDDSPIKLSLEDNVILLENCTTEFTSPDLTVEKKEKVMKIQLNLDEKLNAEQFQSFLLSACYEKNKILFNEKKVEFFNIERAEEIFKKINPTQKIKRVVKIDNEDFTAYFFLCQEDFGNQTPVGNISYLNGQLVDTSFTAPLPFYINFKKDVQNEKIVEDLMKNLQEKEIVELNNKMKILLMRNISLYKKYIQFFNGKKFISLEEGKNYFSTNSSHVYQYTDREDIIFLEGVLDEQVLPYLGEKISPLDLKVQGENKQVSGFFNELFGIVAEMGDVKDLMIIARGMISPYLLSMYTSDPSLKKMFGQKPMLFFPSQLDLTKFTADEILRVVAKQLILAKIEAPKVLYYLDNIEEYKKAYDEVISKQSKVKDDL